MSVRSRPPRSVARFADGLLETDLPLLGHDRREETVEFIARRVQVLPSLMRFGVLTIGAVVDAVSLVVGRTAARRFVTNVPLPLVSEYPRLVRSLGYAYIWETWPDTNVDGGRPV